MSANFFDQPSGHSQQPPGTAALFFAQPAGQPGNADFLSAFGSAVQQQPPPLQPAQPRMANTQPTPALPTDNLTSQLFQGAGPTDAFAFAAPAAPTSFFDAVAAGGGGGVGAPAQQPSRQQPPAPPPPTQHAKAAGTAADFFATISTEQSVAPSIFPHPSSGVSAHRAEQAEPLPAFFSVTSAATHTRASAMPPPLPELSTSHNPPPLHSAPPPQPSESNGGPGVSSFFSGPAQAQPPLFGTSLEGGSNVASRGRSPVHESERQSSSTHGPFVSMHAPDTGPSSSALVHAHAAPPPPRQVPGGFTQSSQTNGVSFFTPAAASQPPPLAPPVLPPSASAVAGFGDDDEEGGLGSTAPPPAAYGHAQLPPKQAPSRPIGSHLPPELPPPPQGNGPFAHHTAPTHVGHVQPAVYDHAQLSSVGSTPDPMPEHHSGYAQSAASQPALRAHGPGAIARGRPVSTFGDLAGVSRERSPSVESATHQALNATIAGSTKASTKTKVCAQCRQPRPLASFSKSQMKKKDQARCGVCCGDDETTSFNSVAGALTAATRAELIMREQRAHQEAQALKALAAQEQADREAARLAEQQLRERRAQLAALERRRKEEELARLEQELKAEEERLRAPPPAPTPAAQAVPASTHVSPAIPLAVQPVAQAHAPPAPVAAQAQGHMGAAGAIPVHFRQAADTQGDSVQAANLDEPSDIELPGSQPPATASTSLLFHPSDFNPLSTSSPGELARPAASTAAAATVASAPSTAPPPVNVGPDASAAHNYQEFRTPEGRCYYHNPLTNDTRWDPPPGWGAPAAPQTAPESRGGQTCSQCHAALDGSKRFCGYCGTPVARETVPTDCQNPGCHSDGRLRRVVKCCLDNLCRSLNNGRPLYLCGDCEIAMHSHPALRGHDVRPVFLGPTATAQMPEERNFPEDMSMMSLRSRARHDPRELHGARGTHVGSVYGGLATGPIPHAQSAALAHAEPQRAMRRLIGPPGATLANGLPDMRVPENRLWYEQRGIYPEDQQYGQLLEEKVDTPPPPVQSDIPPRPSFPIVTFGFGGTMVVVFPPRRDNEASMDSNSFGFPEERDGDATRAKPGAVRLLDVSTLLASDPSVSALKNNFPGPLRVGSFTVGTNAMNFCEQQAQLAGSGSSSAVLWRLLALRVKHSGSARPAAAPAVGDNQDPFTRDVASMLLQHRVAAPSTQDLSGPDTAQLSELSALLAIGQRSDALQLAMRAQLWDHALIIASRLGPEAFNDVLMRFTGSRTSSGDPLRFLYSLYAGRTPNALSGAAVLGGDDIARWPEALAAILSNPAPGDVNLVKQLGDSLLCSGDVCAAHVCYLCIEDSLGTRLVQLYGARADETPSPESIQRTEVAEYAASLSGLGNSFASFLPHKLAYACWLADCSRFQTASEYCEVIGNTLRQLPASTVRDTCSPALIRRLLDLEARLRGRTSTGPVTVPPELWRHQIPGLLSLFGTTTEGQQEQHSLSAPTLPPAALAATGAPAPASHNAEDVPAFSSPAASALHGSLEATPLAEARPSTHAQQPAQIATAAVSPPRASIASVPSHTQDTQGYSTASWSGSGYGSSLGSAVLLPNVGNPSAQSGAAIEDPGPQPSQNQSLPTAPVTFFAPVAAVSAATPPTLPPTLVPSAWQPPLEQPPVPAPTPLPPAAPSLASTTHAPAVHGEPAAHHTQGQADPYAAASSFGMANGHADAAPANAYSAPTYFGASYSTGSVYGSNTDHTGQDHSNFDSNLASQTDSLASSMYGQGSLSASMNIGPSQTYVAPPSAAPEPVQLPALSSVRRVAADAQPPPPLHEPAATSTPPSASSATAAVSAPAAPAPSDEGSKKSSNKAGSSSSGGGLISRIFGGLRGKNQMHLPEDSNTAFEFDKETGAWLPTDPVARKAALEERAKTAAPPPMASFASAPPTGPAPAPSSGPPAPAPAASAQASAQPRAMVPPPGDAGAPSAVAPAAPAATAAPLRGRLRANRTAEAASAQQQQPGGFRLTDPTDLSGFDLTARTSKARNRRSYIPTPGVGIVETAPVDPGLVPAAPMPATQFQGRFMVPAASEPVAEDPSSVGSNG